MNDDANTRPIEARLEELGPLMARQDDLEQGAARAEFVRELRTRLETTHPATRRSRSGRRGRVILGGFGAVLLGGGAAIAALVQALSGSGHGSPVPAGAFSLPRVSRADVLRGYPLNGGLGGGMLPPWSSSLGPIAGTAYAGSLHFRGNPRSVQNPARAYALVEPGVVVRSFSGVARSLGIQGATRPATVAGEHWLYRATGQAPQYGLSLAVSRRTGEMIYRDARSVGPGRPLPSSRRIAIARRFLRGLGLSGLPVRAPQSAKERLLPGIVSFDWKDAPPGDVPAVSVTVGNDAKVLEAHIWPRIAAVERVPVIPLASAWRQVRTGSAPVGVEDVIGLPPREGDAALSRVQSGVILVGGKTGRLYLAPSYRFSGTVRLHGDGEHGWYAQVPISR